MTRNGPVPVGLLASEVDRVCRCVAAESSGSVASAYQPSCGIVGSGRVQGVSMQHKKYLINPGVVYYVDPCKQSSVELPVR